MDFDRNILQSRIVELTHPGQTFFAFLCAERLRACCWAFSKRENWDIAKYFEGCELLFQHLTYHTSLELSEVERLIKEIDKSVPQSDEFGDPLSVQAQNGMLALLYAFDAWKMTDPVAAISAAGNVVDGLDNYDSFIIETLTGELKSPAGYPLLDREIKWQFESLDILKQLIQAESKDFISLRIRNRHYVVPIAI